MRLSCEALLTVDKRKIVCSTVAFYCLSNALHSIEQSIKSHQHPCVHPSVSPTFEASYLHNDHSCVIYTVSPKNIPDIFDCNLKNNYQILIIFGTNIPDTTCHQLTVQFSTSSSICFCTTWGKHNQQNITFLRAKAKCFARLCHRLGVRPSVRPSVRLSVCPSVRPSHSWAVSKRCKLVSRNLHCGLPQGL